MIYSWIINTPEKTYEDDKQLTRLKLARGVIHQVDIFFPPGPAGLLHLHINEAVHQRWPTNPSENYAVDDDVISFREYLELTEEPYELQAWTWNTSTDWPHLVVVRIGLLRRRFVLRRLL